MPPRSPLPEGWEVPIRRTSCRPSQIILGVPMEVLGLALWLTAQLALVFGAWPQALAAFLALWLPARYLTAKDPWWLEIVRQGGASRLHGAFNCIQIRGGQGRFRSLR